MSRPEEQLETSSFNFKLTTDDRENHRKYLTPSQAQVLKYIAMGYKSSEIAQVTGISFKTVENHKNNAFRNIDAQNNMQALLISINGGLLPLSYEFIDPAILYRVELLSSREREIIEAMLADNGARSARKQVATSLAISLKTVEDQLITINDRLGTRNAEQAVVHYLASQREGSILLGGPYIDPPPSRSKSELDFLTRREKEIWGLIAEGLPTKHIAARLDIALKTVENTKRKLFIKLGVHKSAQAVVLYQRQVEQADVEPEDTEESIRVEAQDISHSIKLTAREIDVLLSVRSGSNTREIAERLGISTKTVENHKHRIFTKLDVHNQAHAVARAYELGIFP